MNARRTTEADRIAEEVFGVRFPLTRAELAAVNLGLDQLAEERIPAPRPTSAPHGRLDELATAYKDAGYRPIVDSLREVVLVDCPRCHAQDHDDLAMYRPARVVPRGRRHTFICDSCGTTRDG